MLLLLATPPDMSSSTRRAPKRRRRRTTSRTTSGTHKHTPPYPPLPSPHQPTRVLKRARHRRSPRPPLLHQSPSAHRRHQPRRKGKARRTRTSTRAGRAHPTSHRRPSRRALAPAAQVDRLLSAQFSTVAALDNELHERVATPPAPPAPPAPPPPATPLPDLEDLDAALFAHVVPYVDYRVHRCLSVTDFAGQAWCEQERAFQLELGVRRSKAQERVLAAGSARHLQLEQEVHDIVDVPVETREDKYALRFANAIACVTELLTHGLTRELPVFGRLARTSSERVEVNSPTSGVWVCGVIDEVRRVVSALDGSVSFVVSDSKTRAKPSQPSLAQKRTTCVQLMLYKVLFDGLAVPGDRRRLPVASLLRHLNLDADRAVGDALVVYCREHLQLQLPAYTCATIGHAMVERFSAVGQRSSADLVVTYEHQGTKAALGEFKFHFTDAFFHREMAHYLEYWLGIRQTPRVVQSFEKWKCNYCMYRAECTRSPAPPPPPPPAPLTRRCTIS